MAVNIVTNRKMATVWATSSHLIPPLVRLTGSSKVHIHRKNRMMEVPRMKIEPKRRGRIDGQRTIQYRAGNHPSEIGLLVKIQLGWDVRRVGVVIQELWRRIGHDLKLGTGFQHEGKPRRLEVRNVSGLKTPESPTKR